ncbi:MAG: hypothetical protein LBI27_07545 [Clostridiales bacterium]|jgi:hypothetical protein|nr:hypothetical protein [Clostridiales bacterium]
MEWERAKNYILTAFVLLNLSLAGLLFREDSRYTLSQERISNIHAVLTNNNINLYTNPMRRFAPMRHLEVMGFDYDIPELIEIFFGEDAQVIQLEADEGHYIFESENEEHGRLEISNGFIYFDNNLDLGENRDEKNISHEFALEIADVLITEHFPDFVADMVFDEIDGNGVQIIYRQKYRGRIIHSNFIEFLVTSEGIAWIDMHYGRVIGYGADPRMIFAPDEILLTFMQRVQHIAAEKPIFISHIDIVYNSQEDMQEGVISPAVPFYRIFIRDHDFPFLINAYTNVYFE